MSLHVPENDLLTKLADEIPIPQSVAKKVCAIVEQKGIRGAVVTTHIAGISAGLAMFPPIQDLLTYAITIAHGIDADLIAKYVELNTVDAFLKDSIDHRLSQIWSVVHTAEWIKGFLSASLAFGWGLMVANFLLELIGKCFRQVAQEEGILVSSNTHRM